MPRLPSKGLGNPADYAPRGTRIHQKLACPECGANVRVFYPYAGTEDPRFSDAHIAIHRRGEQKCPASGQPVLDFFQGDGT